MIIMYPCAGFSEILNKDLLAFCTWALYFGGLSLDFYFLFLIIIILLI